MLLARATSRGREMSIRLALGAGRSRLLRQLLTEASLLAALGGLLGLGLAWFLTRWLLVLVPDPGVGLQLEPVVDSTVVLFTLGVTVFAALMFGLAPALHATRRDLIGALRDDDRLSRAPQTLRLRRMLITAQMAVTVVLMISSGLFLRAFWSARTLDLGIQTQGLYTTHFNLEVQGYDARRALDFFRELMNHTSALPGVESVALARKLPLASISTMGPGHPLEVPPTSEDQVPVHFNIVGGSYFESLDITFLNGRTFYSEDHPEAPPVAVINETMASRFWPNQDPVGRQFFVGPSQSRQSYQVIGLASDAHYHGLVESTPNFIYLPISQRPNDTMTLLIRSSNPHLQAGLQDIVRDLDRGIPLLAVTPLDEVLGQFFTAQRVAAWITGLVGLLGLLLGSIGIYGVTTFAVETRRKELGVRLALGASTDQLRALLLRKSALASLLGILIGVSVSLAIVPLLQQFLLDVHPFDPLTFLIVVLLLLMVSFVAHWIPLRQILRIDPAKTLSTQ